MATSPNEAAIDRETKRRVTEALWSIAEARAPGVYPIMSPQAHQALKDCQEAFEWILRGLPDHNWTKQEE